jgi:hypothetical protein
LRICTPAAMTDVLMTMIEGGRVVPGSAATFQNMIIRGETKIAALSIQLSFRERTVFFASVIFHTGVMCGDYAHSSRRHLPIT